MMSEEKSGDPRRITSVGHVNTPDTCFPGGTFVTGVIPASLTVKATPIFEVLPKKYYMAVDRDMASPRVHIRGVDGTYSGKALQELLDDLSDLIDAVGYATDDEQ
jgi:hypothetical protein